MPISETTIADDTRMPTDRSAQAAALRERIAARDLPIMRENLRIAVALRETSMSEVALAAGMSRNGLSQFIGGSSVLTSANLIAVCHVLDVPVALIFREDGISRANIRLYKALERMPTHALGEAEALINGKSSE